MAFRIGRKVGQEPVAKGNGSEAWPWMPDAKHAKSSAARGATIRSALTCFQDNRQDMQ